MLVIVGPIEDVIGRALQAGCGSALELRSSSARAQALIDEGRAAGAVAVITRRDEILDLCGELPGDILVLGISTTSWTVLACHGAEMTQIPNPHPESLTAIIRTWAEDRVVEGGPEIG